MERGGGGEINLKNRIVIQSIQWTFASLGQLRLKSGFTRLTILQFRRGWLEIKIRIRILVYQVIPNLGYSITLWTITACMTVSFLASVNVFWANMFFLCRDVIITRYCFVKMFNKIHIFWQKVKWFTIQTNIFSKTNADTSLYNYFKFSRHSPFKIPCKKLIIFLFRNRIHLTAEIPCLNIKYGKKLIKFIFKMKK